MLFAVLGALMEKAAATLRSEAVAAGGEHGDVQRRRVAAFLARLGRMWPRVLPALERENRVLAAAVTDGVARHGIERTPGPATADDPVAVHVHLLSELDRLVVALHAAGDQEWAVTARRRVRRSLVDAARIEMALVGSAPPR